MRNLLTLVLAVVVMSATVAQAAVWDAEYDFGSGAGEHATIESAGLYWNWGDGAPNQTAMSDYIEMDFAGTGNTNSWICMPAGGINPYDQYTFEFTVATFDGAKEMFGPAYNIFIVNGGPYDATPNKLSDYANGVDIAPAGFDSSQVHTYTIANPGTFMAEVWLDGELIGEVARNAGGASDGLNLEWNIADQGIHHIYSLKVAGTYIQPVPEPTTMVVLALGGVCALRRRNK